MNVRTANPEDAAAMAALSSQLGYPVSAEDLLDRLRFALSRPDELVLVADGPKNTPIGWIQAAERQTLESKRSCELVGLVVDSAHRREGVGQKLVAAVEAWTAARGLTVLTVRSNTIRPESHPFYERLGYERAKTQHVYRKLLR